MGRKESDELLGVPCTILPGYRRLSVRGRCWGWFGGGCVVRGCIDLFRCSKDFDEQLLEVFLGFAGLGITGVIKKGDEGPNGGYITNTPSECFA